MVFRTDEEAAAALAEAADFFLFVLEGCAMVNPKAIRPGFLPAFRDDLDHLVIKHEIPEVVF